MRLTDIMSHMGISGYTQIALVLFLAVFVGQALWAFLPRNHAMWQRAGELPLDDEPARERE